MKNRLKSFNEASSKGIMFAVIATFAARIVGFIRELYTAKIFGTSALGDAFIVAFSIPDILLSGFTFAVATLYIPTYHKVINDKQSISRYNSSVFVFVTLIGLIFTVLIEAFPQIVIDLFASGFNADTKVIAIDLIRIIIISVIPIFWGSVLKAYGQVVNIYSLLTFLGVLSNITIIAALALVKPINMSILGLSVLAGNVLYIFVAYLIVRKKGFKLSKHFKLHNKYLHTLIIGIIPVFFSNIISEVNQIIDKNFASHLTEGSVSGLNYSSKIINLITAILGTAISSVLFSNLSKIAMSKDNEKLDTEVRRINSCVFAIILPFFFFVLFDAQNIVRILFERGSFNSESVRLTTECLIFYSLGIIGFNLKAIWTRVYNASLNTKIPAINSALAVLFNIIFNFCLMPLMKHKGLALATALSSLITDLLLIINYHTVNSNFHGTEMLKDGIVVCFLSIFSAIPMYLTGRFCNSLSPLIAILVNILVWIFGILVYILLLCKTNTFVGIELKKSLKRMGESR